VAAPESQAVKESARAEKDMGAPAYLSPKVGLSDPAFALSGKHTDSIGRNLLTDKAGVIYS